MKPPKMLINAQALVSIESVYLGEKTICVKLKDEAQNSALTFVFKRPDTYRPAEFIGEAHSQIALDDLLQKAGE